jgi:hypothetical protein
VVSLIGAAAEVISSRIRSFGFAVDRIWTRIEV